VVFQGGVVVSDGATVALKSTRPSMDSQRPLRIWSLFATATWVR
jgi:hypothetical protein